MPQDGAIHADMNGTLPRFVREWPAKNWVRVSRSWQIEAGSLLADSSTWRGTHDVDWEISRPENSTFAIRGRRHGQVVHFVLFLDMQCIQASGSGSPTVHGHCGTVRYLLPLVKKAFPFDPQVQSLEYGGPEAVE